MHGAAHLIAIQIESAVYLGNSGGSALKENKVVGVVRKNTSKGRKQKILVRTLQSVALDLHLCVV